MPSPPFPPRNSPQLIEVIAYEGEEGDESHYPPSLNLGFSQSLRKVWNFLVFSQCLICKDLYRFVYYLIMQHLFVDSASK